MPISDAGTSRYSSDHIHYLEIIIIAVILEVVVIERGVTLLTMKHAGNTVTRAHLHGAVSVGSFLFQLSNIDVFIQYLIDQLLLNLSMNSRHVN